MARNENENLNGLLIPETDELINEYIDKTGNISDEKDAVAKIAKINNKEDNRSTMNYYVKCGRGMVFDPYGMDMNKLNSYNFQFKKVDQKIYSQYIQYLKTRRSIFLTYAQRDFTNRGY
jgi:hypothetical protein